MKVGDKPWIVCYETGEVIQSEITNIMDDDVDQSYIFVLMDHGYYNKSNLYLTKREALESLRKWRVKQINEMSWQIFLIDKEIKKSE
jgi:hypothetical protein